MAGINGKNLSLPPVGMKASPNQLYINRCRVGYGDSGRTAGGGSDGCHKWLDTAGTVSAFVIPAVSSDRTSDGLSFGAVVIHDVFTIVKVAFAGASAVTVGDCGTAEGWLEDTDAAITSTGVATVTPSSAFNSVGFGPYIGRDHLYCTTDPDHVKLVFTGDATAGIMDVYVVWSMVDFDQLANTDWPNS